MIRQRGIHKERVEKKNLGTGNNPELLGWLYKKELIEVYTGGEVYYLCRPATKGGKVH